MITSVNGYDLSRKENDKKKKKPILQKVINI